MSDRIGMNCSVNSKLMANDRRSIIATETNNKLNNLLIIITTTSQRLLPTAVIMKKGFYWARRGQAFQSEMMMKLDVPYFFDEHYT